MPYLFTPPFQVVTHTLEGSLRYSYPVSETVWKDASGVWQHQGFVASDTLSTALVVFAGRPQVISDDLAAELRVANIGYLEHIS